MDSGDIVAFYSRVATAPADMDTANGHGDFGRCIMLLDLMSL